MLEYHSLWRKQVTLVESCTWINEHTLTQMKLQLVNDAWVRPDGRTDAGASSSSMPFVSSTEVLELLRSLHLKQDTHLRHLQGLETRFDNLGVRLDNEFLEVHQRMNAITSQLNHIQEQIDSEDEWSLLVLFVSFLLPSALRYVVMHFYFVMFSAELSLIMIMIMILCYDFFIKCLHVESDHDPKCLCCYISSTKLFLIWQKGEKNAKAFFAKST